METIRQERRARAFARLQLLLAPSRMKLYAVAFLLELAIFFAATLAPVAPSQKQILLNQGRDLINNATSGTPPQTIVLIFANNFRIALFDIVPLFGAFFFGYSMFATGQVIQVLAQGSNVPPLALGAVYFLFPYTVVELAAYALAVSEGVMIIWAVKRHGLRRELSLLPYGIILLAGVLVLAATFETVFLVSTRAGLTLWLPLGLIVMAAVRHARKKS
ncbi:MAG: stage II sporulation protein M [Thaumarchaeota archaeon]|nr:stage II sporulation protein M [Nitrososphaerota archaeon]